MRTMPGAHYPDELPAVGQPVPDADPADERTMALRFVRSQFDPPLPDAFADWLIALHAMVRDGYPAQYAAVIPPAIRELGFTFEHSQGGRLMRLDDALRLFGRHDLLDDAPALPEPMQGFTALAAALAAHGVRSTLTLRRNARRATLDLDGEQAQTLADLLIPAEGSTEDDLAIALELLNHFTDDPRPTPCSLDHHGHCQEHHDDLDDGRFAQHEAYALLVRRGVRAEES